MSVSVFWVAKAARQRGVMALAYRAEHPGLAPVRRHKSLAI